MYQHLSETAKDVLKQASGLAREDQQEYVGTEHVLLAIMQQGLGVGAQVLRNFSASAETIQDRIAQLVRRSNEETWVFGRLPGTPHFKQVLAYAIEEAEKVKDTKVGTEYLLLGLLREKGCLAERALRQEGVTLELARREVAKLQGRVRPGGRI